MIKTLNAALAWTMIGAACMGAAAPATPKEPMLTEVPLTAVKLSDDFWSPRLAKNRTVTIPHNFRLCEETGRIANFARAGKLEAGPYQGLLFNDSDVYK